MPRVSLFRKSVIVIGFVAFSWQIIFIVLYLSMVLPRMNSHVSDAIMTGAAVCGVIGTLTCYFPYFLKDQIDWMTKREGSSVAISFALLFFSFAITLLVLTATWIGSM
jgi:hypothetical protein